MASKSLPTGFIKKLLLRNVDDKEVEELKKSHEKDSQVSQLYSDSIWNRNDYSNQTLLKEIPNMLRDPIINSALSLLMDMSFKPNQDGDVMWVTSKHKIISDELNKFHRTLNFNEFVLKMAYNLLLYGNLPYKHIFEDKKLVGLVPIPDFTSVDAIEVGGQFLGFFMDQQYYYPYEFTFAQLSSYKDLGGPLTTDKYRSFGTPTKKEEELNEFRNEFVYAPSYLSAVVKIWRNKNIISDALLLARMDSTQYYRLIVVDVGRDPTAKEATALLNFYRNTFKKRRQISFDPGSMSTKGTGADFEIVLPGNPSKLDIKDVASTMDIKGIRDLEVVTQELFAALKVSPSQIGYSEDTPSSLGDSANRSWDARLERVCSSIVYSCTLACRQFDRVYLLSRGFNVEDTDWSYQTVSITHIDDVERAEALKASVESLGNIIKLFKDAEISYDAKYLATTVLGPTLLNGGLDVDRLFPPEDATEAESEAPPEEGEAEEEFMTSSKKRLMSSLKRFGIVESDSDFSSGVSQMSSFSAPQSIKFSHIDKALYPDSTEVDVSEIIHGDAWKGLGEAHFISTDTDVSVPITGRVFISPNIGSIYVRDLSKASIQPLKSLTILNSQYYIEDREDFVTYLHLINCGLSDVYVNRVSVYQI